MMKAIGRQTFRGWDSEVQTADLLFGLQHVAGQQGVKRESKL
jgi:hypothetical protein